MPSYYQVFFFDIFAIIIKLEFLMQNLSKVTKLVLDFGGVIYTISHDQQKSVFAKLGIKNFDELYSHAIQSSLFADFECGKISNDIFRTKVKKIIGKEISDEELDHAWNSILVGFPDDTIHLLEHLKHHFTLYLLSNTNAIHYDVYTREFLNRYGYDFKLLFEKIAWSFLVKKRKPSEDIFKYVISEFDLNQENALFIDDTRTNIVHAEKAGIPSYWLQHGKRLCDLFDENYKLKL